MAIGALGSLGSVNSSQLHVGGIKPKSATNVLEDMDADKSGSVSKAEFVAIGEKLKAAGPPGGGAVGGSGPTPPSADQAFSAADKNADASLSVDELSSMMAQAETRRATGAGGSSGRGGPTKAGGPGGGGPPPGGSGMKTSSDSDSSSSSATTDPADTNKDGTVSAAEKLIYELSHPTSSGTAST